MTERITPAKAFIVIPKPFSGNGCALSVNLERVTDKIGILDVGQSLFVPQLQETFWLWVDSINISTDAIVQCEIDYCGTARCDNPDRLAMRLPCSRANASSSCERTRLKSGFC